MFTSQTGKEFATTQQALAYIRECQAKMLDPGASMVDTSRATIEMLYTFTALDEELSRGGSLPHSWAGALNPYQPPSRPRDMLDMS